MQDVRETVLVVDDIPENVDILVGIDEILEIKEKYQD